MSKLTVLFIFTSLLTVQIQADEVSPATAPLYRVSVVQSASKAINYRDLVGYAEIDFKGTMLLPNAMVPLMS